MKKKLIILDGISLTPENVELVAKEETHVSVADRAEKRIQASRKCIVSALEQGKLVYGVNTGFGALSNVVIDPDQIEELQENIVRSHSTGIGEPFSEIEVRAMMLLR
ncbi:hypothetical protein LCGC14_2987300, partial [marine sediment metagenome]